MSICTQCKQDKPLGVIVQGYSGQSFYFCDDCFGGEEEEEMSDEQNFDHHNGKVVKSVQATDDRSTITFEDDSVIDVPGVISQAIQGQVLLTVEPGPSLIFGRPQKDGPALRQTEIELPKEEESEEKPEAKEKTVEDVEPDDDVAGSAGVTAKPSQMAEGGRQRGSRPTNG